MNYTPTTRGVAIQTSSTGRYESHSQRENLSYARERVNEGVDLPELCTFYGIRITLYFGDHPPAHFHAQYGDWKASIQIDDGELVAGKLPRQASRLVEEWRAQRNELPGTVEPLA